MAITTLDGLIQGFTPPINFIKPTFTSEGGGTYSSYLRTSGVPGPSNIGGSFTGGSGYNCNSNTLGALPLPIYPENGKMYLARFGAGATIASTVILYDRLWNCTGILMNTASLQTIVSPGVLPPRDINGTSSGVGVEAWGHIVGVGGATAATWTIRYTNTSGLSPRTGTYSHPNNAESVWQAFPFILQENDLGVSSIQSVGTSNTATAGNLGLMLIRRYAEVPCNVVGVGFYHDPITLGLPEIPSGACLSLMALNSSATAPQILGSLIVATG